MRWLTGFLGAIVLMALAEPAEAIPAFARKYRTSCTTCHVVFPKLNPFGETFRINGFKIPEDDEFFVKDNPIVLGAKAWMQLWPKALWPSTLPHLPPISFLTQFTLDSVEGDSNQGNLQVPDQFTLLAAGTFGEDIGFFVHSGAGSRFYVTFNDILDETLGENAFNFKLGLYEPGLVALTNVRRPGITQTVFSTFEYELDSGNGNIFSIDRQIGVEFNGVIKDRWRYILGVVQGDGDSADSNEKKDIYSSISYKFGGLTFSGSNIGEASDSLKQTENWTDNSVILDVFGYFGRATPDDASVAGFNPYDVDVIRLGVDVRANWKDFEITTGFLTGEDTNADNDGADVPMELFYIQGDVMLYPWLLGYVRYEDLRYSGPKRSELLDDEVRRFVFGANAALRANVKLIIEYVLNNDGGGRDDADLFFLAFTFAF